MTAVVEHAQGYGRIVRSGAGASRSPASRLHVLSRRRTPARPSARFGRSTPASTRLRWTGCSTRVRGLGTDNAQKEYYLPDLVAVFRQRGLIVETVTVANPDEIRGINSRIELAAVSRIVRQAKNAELMAAGVTIEDPATTYIDRDVVGRRRHDHPPGRVARRRDDGRRAAARFTAASRIVNSQIGDRVTVLNHCVINESRVADDASVGPFSHLRNGRHDRSRARRSATSSK